VELARLGPVPDLQVTVAPGVCACGTPFLHFLSFLLACACIHTACKHLH
jgi:hypothetical protein